MMSALVVIVMVLMRLDHGVAKPSNNDTNNTNTVLNFGCGSSEAMSAATFSKNLELTISQLRGKLSNTGVYYAKAQSLENGDAVYGFMQCRKYLSTAQCLACFEVAVSALKPCEYANGAHVFLDNCYLRYENVNKFYVVPQDNLDTVNGICGNESTSQPIIAFKQAVEGLLSDIRVATPRTSDFYTVSTRHVSTSDNATVYAMGQCIEKISQAICKNCMDMAYNRLAGCLPSKEARAIDVACFMRYSEFPFFQVMIPFLRKGSSSKSGLIVGVSSSAGFLALILAFSLWYRKRKKSNSDGADTVEFEGQRSYDYQELKIATNNFSEDCLVGKGGFGKVFKANLNNGDVVAVKKLHGTGHRERKDFVNEVKLLSNVRHRNLIVQLGWCIDGPDLLLVLEYVPQGSLDKFLWGKYRGTLNWKQRSSIILGIARGLAHLHDELHVKIVHRDIKSSNIFLDDDFQPKIGDFGLAKFQPDDQTHVSTSFAGTFGYAPPEYATYGHLSEKVDTYSFGIVALEVICGQRSTDHGHCSGPRMECLLDYAWQLYDEGIHLKLMDEALVLNDCEEEHAMNIIEIALKCTQSPPSLRPTMSEVVLMLCSEPTSRQRQMNRPTFVDDDRRIDILERKITVQTV